MAEDPLDEFDAWFSGALEAGLEEPNAFVLATAGADGQPSARAVLMKELDQRGLVFYTGATSRKSRDMRATSRAAATFVWIPLHRQVRFEGEVSPVDDSQADAYFATRPRGAQIAAHASHQSDVVTGRSQLEERFAELEREFAERDIPRPAHWSGWRLSPMTIEFWQGRPNRFHDRIRYSRSAGSWHKERLAP